MSDALPLPSMQYKDHAMMLLFTFYQCMYLKTILLLTRNILSLLLDISYKIAFIAGKNT